MHILMTYYLTLHIALLISGFGAVIVGGTPGTILYLTGYAFIRDTLSSAVLKWCGGDATISASNDHTKPSLTIGEEFAVHFSSGMLAEAVTCIIYVPVDVVKERMQVQQKAKDNLHNTHQYNGSWDAFQKIMRTEGFQGIYRGYGATLASFGPFSALYFMFYEQCKSISRNYIDRRNQDGRTQINNNQKHVKDGELPLHHLVACSAGAGALASWLTSPLDMAKLRLQVQRGQAATTSNGRNGTKQPQQYRGMLDCLSSAYKEAGIPGLFRGAGARVIHFAPATTITMTCYEKCRSFYADALS